MSQTRDQILFLAQNDNWNNIQASDDPALNEAVRLKSCAIVEAICKNNYDLALRRATYGQFSTMVPLLLPYRNNVNSPSPKTQNRTALHFAAMNGMTDCIKQLIDAGAYVNVCDIDGNTPAHLACLNNHPATAAMLAKYGAYAVANLAQRSPMSLVNPAAAHLFDEYKKLSRDVSLLKSKQPSAMGTRFENLVVRGNVIMRILDGVSEQQNQHEDRGQAIEFSLDEQLKLKELCGLPKVLHLTLKEYMELDLKFRDILPMHLTMPCGLYGNRNNDVMLISVKPEQVSILTNTAKDWDAIEKKTGISFELIFEDYSLNACFLKSKHSHHELPIDKQYWSRNDSGTIRIDSKNFAIVIRELNQLAKPAPAAQVSLADAATEALREAVDDSLAQETLPTYQLK